MLVHSLGEKQAEAEVKDNKSNEALRKPKGIPGFWLTVFKKVHILRDMIQEHDESILKHLQDVNVKCSKHPQLVSFTLEFTFEPNQYFTNEVITKTPPEALQHGMLIKSSAARLAADFEIGRILREHIIPCAMSYFRAEIFAGDTDSENDYLAESYERDEDNEVSKGLDDEP
ncbi:nucleosome assembly protein 1-like 1 [Scyliorhinus canicula]|uniref:nucleosome assembly protein 1-like 1 n=1 Tax=Scyliorhinus canicula TaxID=7830 RepID=UPI0018F2CA98|nr:nucleosome assembly protein 1-like 1 [Scyliorhinus canicula]